MRIAVPLLALLVLCAGTVPAVALEDGGTAPASVADGPSIGADRPVLVGPSLARIDDPEVTELYIAPDPDGNARWTVSVRYNLSTSSDRAAFADYGREFEAAETDVGLDAEFFRTLAAAAGRETGREMAVRNVSRTATVRNGTGTLSLSFTWTNFVTDTDAGFVIRDAVLMPDNRTWLASIGPSQRLVVETPEGYQVTDTRFGLDNGSVVIDGPHTFREPLSISYQETAVEPEPEPNAGPPWSLIGGALVVGLALVAAIVYSRRRDSADEAPSDAPDEPTDAGAVEAPPDAIDAGGETGGAVDDAAEDDDEAGDVVDPALLSDEERVEHLLDQNGGRMKQARIVRETGWSDAKVSQLLSTMADEGRIEKLRLGRENLISLPDEEP
ncbi:helix-turn-helix transcriptional regulator [Haloplanus rubicundus]|uniref:Transmembrane glycoprotein / HTH domain protein n=1 Tax=Haloplanus rubicundus TaxID=1547898 RepID=A0A345EAR6_9EURY|nr:hypothetical protein [Haloplanus rubicundus]AXG09288.1 hypothetical protein DU484_05075 [Haloplanus rubicundus]